MLKRFELVFACKKCKKAFRKDARDFDEADEYCPHCDNHFVLEARVAKPVVKLEGEDIRKDSRMVKDERIKGWDDELKYDIENTADRLG